jgi:rhodanese-related sulfurtransferase
MSGTGFAARTICSILISVRPRLAKLSALVEAAFVTISGMYSVRRNGALDPDELAASLHDYVVVDVRDRSGWRGGHIPGSIHVPINHLDAGLIGDDKRLPLAVLADSDRDAEVAVGALVRQGWDALTISGGAPAWRASGQCLVTNRN